MFLRTHEQGVGRHRPHLRAVLVAVDLLAVAVAVAGGAPADASLTTLASAAAGGATTFYLLNRAHDLYRSYVSAARVVAYAALLRSAVVATGIAHLVLLASDARPSLAATGLAGVAAFLVSALGRYGFDRWLAGRRQMGELRRSVLAVGDPDAVRSLVRLFAARPALGVDVVGAVGPRDAASEVEAASGPVPWLGPVADAARVVEELGISGVVIGPGGVPTDQVRAVVRDLEHVGAHVCVASGLRGIDYRRIRTVGLAHEPFFYLEQPSFSRSQLAAKRALDLALASVLLAVSLPILVVAAVAVRLADGGPALFRQVRVGRDGRPITILKLRTMVPDAEQRLVDLRQRNERVGGPLFKMADDPRVTRIGRFLRTSSLDELPQLLQVLRGEMSMVGPRPALPEEVAAFDAELLDRLRTKPGLTGLWQIEARDEPDFDEYRHLDLFYVENWSLVLDLFIICDTVPAVLERGIRALRNLAPAAPTPAVAPLAATESTGSAS